MDSTGSAPRPLFGRTSSVALAALTGFLFYASYPGLDLWPLAFFAWIPWMLVLPGSTPRQAMLQGFAAGLIIGVCGFYWLMNMLETFSGFPSWICAVLMVIVCAFQAGRYSLLGWIYTRAEARGWPAGLVFTAAFSTSELVYPLLFPFFFSAAVHEVYPIVQVAELGGPILVALVVLAPSWALSRVIAHAIQLKRAGEHVGFSRPFVEVGWRRWGFGFAVPLVALVYGMIRIVQVDEAVHHAEKVRIGIVQANMSLIGKRENLKEGRERHIQLTKKLVKEQKVDLVVWPETSIAGAVEEAQANLHYKRNITKRLGVPTILGAILVREVDDARKYIMFNSALMSDERGDIVGRYDKQFLVPFSEYIPWGDDYPILYGWSPNSSRFSPGTSYDPLPFRGHKIATFICYEDIIPYFVNQLMQKENPELLVNMTNDAWFGDTSEPWEHMALAKFRAVEQRRYLVRSTNSGISGFVDPVGRLVAQTNTFEQAAIAKDVAFLNSTTVYRVVGDSPWWLLSILAAVMSFLRPSAFTRWRNLGGRRDEQLRTEPL